MFLALAIAEKCKHHSHKKIQSEFYSRKPLLTVAGAVAKETPRALIQEI